MDTVKIQLEKEKQKTQGKRKTELSSFLSFHVIRARFRKFVNSALLLLSTRPRKDLNVDLAMLVFPCLATKILLSITQVLWFTYF